MSCLDDDIIAGYLQGLLPPSKQQLADQHMDDCPECRALVSELARSTQNTIAGIAAGPQAPGDIIATTPMDSGNAPDSESLPSGTLIADKYLLEAPIARGGMGVVYRATHVGLDRRVAVKLIRGSIGHNVDAFVRFTREARIAARLKSPHVVNVLDLGLAESGVPFLVMEYLEGQDLDSRLQELGPLPLEDALRYVLQVCDGLAEAHEAGIVHRDLKPSNLFLTHHTDGRERVVILDFGISKLTDAKGEEMELTRTGAVIGSPRYMAPEQLSNPRAIDHRADVWSMGVILYELLAGVPPYKARTLVQLIAEILQSQPPKLSNLRAEVSEGLSAVVERCLHREPEERIQSARELGDLLRAALAGQPIAFEAQRKADILPPSTLVFGQRRSLVPLVVAASLLIGGGVAVYSLLGDSSRDGQTGATEREAIDSPQAPPAPKLRTTDAPPRPSPEPSAVEIASPTETAGPETHEPSDSSHRPKRPKREGESDKPPKRVDDDDLLDVPL